MSRRTDAKFRQFMRLVNTGKYNFGCNKLRYSSEKEAHQALSSAQESHSAKKKAKVERRYYYCQSCCGYHLTSQPNRKAAKTKRS